MLIKLNVVSKTLLDSQCWQLKFPLLSPTAHTSNNCNVYMNYKKYDFHWLNWTFQLRSGEAQGTIWSCWHILQQILSPFAFLEVKLWIEEIEIQVTTCYQSWWWIRLERAVQMSQVALEISDVILCVPIPSALACNAIWRYWFLYLPLSAIPTSSILHGSGVTTMLVHRPKAWLACPYLSFTPSFLIQHKA